MIILSILVFDLASDVDILHHLLVPEERKKDIGQWSPFLGTHPTMGSA
jgi:hypothetical protein